MHQPRGSIEPTRTNPAAAVTGLPAPTRDHHRNSGEEVWKWLLISARYHPSSRFVLNSTQRLKSTPTRHDVRSEVGSPQLYTIMPEQNYGGGG